MGYAQGDEELFPYFNLLFPDIKELFKGLCFALRNPGNIAQNEGHIGGISRVHHWYGPFKNFI